MAKKVNIHEAKTHFSKLINRVMGGEEIIIAKAGKPVARLTSISENSTTRSPGSAKGKITISEDFNDPLPTDLMDSFDQ